MPEKRFQISANFTHAIRLVIPACLVDIESNVQRNCDNSEEFFGAIGLSELEFQTGLVKKYYSEKTDSFMKSLFFHDLNCQNNGDGFLQ